MITENHNKHLKVGNYVVFLVRSDVHYKFAGNVIIFRCILHGLLFCCSCAPLSTEALLSLGQLRCSFDLAEVKQSQPLEKNRQKDLMKSA